MENLRLVVVKTTSFFAIPCKRYSPHYWEEGSVHIVVRYRTKRDIVTVHVRSSKGRKSQTVFIIRFCVRAFHCVLRKSGNLTGVAQTYKELGLRPYLARTRLPELGLKREILGWLIAARSGHGHFADYQERFRHVSEEVAAVGKSARNYTHSAVQMHECIGQNYSAERNKEISQQLRC